MANRTKNNHYLSISIAKNFRKSNTPMYLLDCKNGKVTNRSTGKDNLFAKHYAWNQKLEDAFNTLENKVAPLIDNILSLPLNNCTKYFDVTQLNDRYKLIFEYILQSGMLQLTYANMEQVDKNQYNLAELIKKSENLAAPTVYLIRYNQNITNMYPLVLLDNAFSISLSPPQNPVTSAGSASFFIPISENYLLYFGTDWEVNNFLKAFQNPHKVNLYRICVENKECLVASQNKSYIYFLASEYEYFELSKKSGAIPMSARNFYKQMK